jgi:hypothetical protein
MKRFIICVLLSSLCCDLFAQIAKKKDPNDEMFDKFSTELNRNYLIENTKSAVNFGKGFGKGAWNMVKGVYELGYQLGTFYVVEGKENYNLFKDALETTGFSWGNVWKDITNTSFNEYYDFTKKTVYDPVIEETANTMFKITHGNAEEKGEAVFDIIMIAYTERPAGTAATKTILPKKITSVPSTNRVLWSGGTKDIAKKICKRNRWKYFRNDN